MKTLRKTLDVLKFKETGYGNFGYTFQTKLKSGHNVRLTINLE